MAVRQSPDIEVFFNRSIEDAYGKAGAFNKVNLVIGIPFYNEKDVLPEVLSMLDESMCELQEPDRTLIVCAGDPKGTEALAAVRRVNLKVPHLEFLMQPGSNGRGSSIRAILEIANRLEADAVIFTADLMRENGRGLHPDWIKRIIEPIRNEYDFVLATFQRHFFEDLLGGFFTAPLLEAFYGYRVNTSLSGIYAMCHDLVEDFCTEIKFWLDITQEFGIDPWLLTRAILWNKKICLVELGARLDDISLDKLNFVFKENARSMFKCLKRDEAYWLETKNFILRTPDIYGSSHRDVPYQPTYSTRDLSLFRYSFYQYKNLAETSYYDYLQEDIENLAPVPAKEFKVEGKIWADIVYRLLFKYWFDTSVRSDDILNSLTFAFGGRIANYIDHIQSLQFDLKNFKGLDVDTLVLGEAAATIEEQRKDFLRLRDDFIQTWRRKKLETRPPLTPAHYLEFVPGIPIVLPKRIEGRGEKVLWTEEMFNRLQHRYHEAFSRFIHNSLQASESSGPRTITRYVKDFMQALEEAMERVFPGNLYTVEGTRQVVHKLFQTFSCPKVFSIKNEVFQEMICRFPPVNVMIPAGCRTPRELMKKMDIRDAVSMANLVETRKYGDRSALMWMLDNLRTDDMGEVDIKPIVLGEEILGGSVKLGSISDLNKLTSRIVIRPLNKSMGGEYPKTRSCLFIGRHIMIAENYAYLWRTYARERKNIGVKIRNSLIGRYEIGVFSAHNIFENLHHRALVAQFQKLSEKLAGTEEGKLIGMMCEGYGLSQVLSDGTFLPCSAWSWASFSYKGGRGVPTPLSSHVEEKWFNHDFLEQIYEELGYDPGEINHTVAQLVGEGRASENLLDVLLGIKPTKNITVVVQETRDYPPAEPLVRYSGNPVLSPIKEHPWENKYVLNAAAFRIKDRVYILYRAFGDDEVSRIGLAVTDGYQVLERLPEPVYVPKGVREKKGVEDPRVVIIDNKIYMLYTAYDGDIAQISAAAIEVNDFLNKKFHKWERKGFAFEDIWDKDAILFPEKINSKYIIYHRIEPSIWVSHLDKLEFPAPKDKHSIILGPRSGRMWDSLKIGAGTQPIKTKYGWLLIYHGVDRNRVYRLGVILADLANPENLLYRSPNPVLSPETEHEIGKEGESWVPNVVFTCGAVPAVEKEVLDAEDEVLVYYGAADTHVCLATGKVGDIIPEPVRKAILEQHQAE